MQIRTSLLTAALLLVLVNSTMIHHIRPYPTRHTQRSPQQYYHTEYHDEGANSIRFIRKIAPLTPTPTPIYPLYPSYYDQPACQAYYSHPPQQPETCNRYRCWGNNQNNNCVRTRPKYPKVSTISSDTLQSEPQAPPQTHPTPAQPSPLPVVHSEPQTRPKYSSENSPLYSQNNRVIGQDNVWNGANNEIQGDSNLLQGDSNQLKGDCNIVVGDLNSCKGDGNLIAGEVNSVCGSDNLVNGCTNTVCGHSNCVSGGENKVSGSANMVTGCSNMVVGTNNMVQGQGNSVVQCLSQLQSIPSINYSQNNYLHC